MATPPPPLLNPPGNVTNRPRIKRGEIKRARNE
nr:MAG TPA: hypothetical protein [Caudoviricetes sp.]